jgi:hypothetical protein
VSTHTQQTETQKLISNLLDTLAPWSLGPKLQLPEKKIPSTQAKANILSAKDSELQNKEKPSIKLQHKPTYSSQNSATRLQDNHAALIDITMQTKGTIINHVPNLPNQKPTARSDIIDISQMI